MQNVVDIYNGGKLVTICRCRNLLLVFIPKLATLSFIRWYSEWNIWLMQLEIKLYTIKILLN